MDQSRKSISIICLIAVGYVNWYEKGSQGEGEGEDLPPGGTNYLGRDEEQTFCSILELDFKF
jgi:hypothetical protein